MKNVLPLLVTFLISAICFGQWSGVGQPIYGEHENDYTGSSVSITGSSDRVAVFDTFVDGDTRGRVRVFEFQNNEWVQLGGGVFGLIGDGSGAGNVVLSDSGNRFIFSSPLHNLNGDYSGVARIFEYQNGIWEQIGDSLFGEVEGDLFGTSVDIDFGGDSIVIGASQAGALNSGSGFVRVYEYQNGNWVQRGLDINGEVSDDEAGSAVSITSDGNRVLMASPGNSQGQSTGRAMVFGFQSNNWVQVGNIVYGELEGDRLGSTVAYGAKTTSFNLSGSRMALGSIGHMINGTLVGQARVFELQNNAWVQLGNSINGTSDNNSFGHSVSLNAAGNILAVGDPFANNNSQGELKVYRLENNNWVAFENSINGVGAGDFLGFCNDINDDGNVVIYGAFLNDEDGLNKGKVEVIENDAILDVSEAKTEKSIILSPNPNNGKFSLDFSAEIGFTSIKIVDALGKTVYSETNISSETFEIDQNFTSGVYFVNVISTFSENTLKMIVE